MWRGAVHRPGTAEYVHFIFPASEKPRVRAHDSEREEAGSRFMMFAFSVVVQIVQYVNGFRSDA